MALASEGAAAGRSRFWGTPLPIWASEDGSELRVVGSVQELEELTGHKVSRGVQDVPPLTPAG